MYMCIYMRTHNGQHDAGPERRLRHLKRVSALKVHIIYIYI